MQTMFSGMMLGCPKTAEPASSREPSTRCTRTKASAQESSEGERGLAPEGNCIYTNSGIRPQLVRDRAGAVRHGDWSK